MFIEHYAGILVYLPRIRIRMAADDENRKQVLGSLHIAHATKVLLMVDKR